MVLSHGMDRTRFSRSSVRPVYAISTNKFQAAESPGATRRSAPPASDRHWRTRPVARTRRTRSGVPSLLPLLHSEGEQAMVRSRSGQEFSVFAFRSHLQGSKSKRCVCSVTEGQVKIVG